MSLHHGIVDVCRCHRDRDESCVPALEYEEERPYAAGDAINRNSRYSQAVRKYDEKDVLVPSSACAGTEETAAHVLVCVEGALSSLLSLRLRVLGEF